MRSIAAEGKDKIPGMSVKAFMDGKETIEGLKDRITGRYSCEDIYDKDGELIVGANHMITPEPCRTDYGNRCQ